MCYCATLLTEPIFLAGLLGFLLENTISGKLRPGPSRLGSGQKSSLPGLGNVLTTLSLQAHGLSYALGQGLPPPFTARKARMPQKSREKADKEYELPFSIQNLCPCIPQPPPPFSACCPKTLGMRKEGPLSPERQLTCCLTLGTSALSLAETASQ